MKLSHLVAALMGLALAAPTSALGVVEPRGGDGGARGGGGGARGGAAARSGGGMRSAPARSAPSRASAPRSAPSRASAPRSAPSRTSAPRASAPRSFSSPRTQSPRFSSSSSPRAQAPRRTSAPRAQSPRFSTSRNDGARVQAPRSTTLRSAFQDGQPVGGGGRVAPAPRNAGTPSARGGTPAPAPKGGGRDAFRGQDVPRGGQRDARSPGSGDRVGRGSDRVSGPRQAPRDLSARPGSGGLPGGRDRTGTRDGFVRRGGLEPGAGGTGTGATDGAGGRMGGRGKSPANWQEYRDGFRNGHRVAPADTKSSTDGHHYDGHHDGHHYDHCGYHDWYDHHGWYLSFSFGYGCGPYFGFSYYWPYHSWNYGCDYAFFYPYPVSYAYVPYGFYVDSTPIYVTRYEYIRESVPDTVYETREVVDAEQAEQLDTGGAIPPEDGEVKVAEPKPAAGSPATEKFLREASGQFRQKQYYEAAVNFRLAALSSPDLSGPLFALGQSLVALGNDEYAARVIRRAVLMDPLILQETGDISGVFESTAEYESVMAALAARAAEAPVDGDARFLLAAERYFAGDPRCREEFDAFHVARPDDGAVELFRSHAARRFKDATDLLPPVESPK